MYQKGIIQRTKLLPRSHDSLSAANTKPGKHEHTAFIPSILHVCIQPPLLGRSQGGTAISTSYKWVSKLREWKLNEYNRTEHNLPFKQDLPSSANL